MLYNTQIEFVIFIHSSCSVELLNDMDQSYEDDEESNGVVAFQELSNCIAQLRQNDAWISACRQVGQDRENLAKWEVLVDTLDTVLEKPSEKSKSQLQELYTAVYNELLARFPLLYGYWLKYIQVEQRFARSTAQPSVELLYERAVAGFPGSVDLWVAYGEYAIKHQSRNGSSEKRVRSILLRGLAHAGRDFLSHPLWDLYISFENSVDQWSEQTARALKTAMSFPLHQYARYYELIQTHGLVAKYPQVFGEDYNLDVVVQETAQATNARWPFESKISRSYFDVVPVEDDQLQNWREYLDFEIEQPRTTQQTEQTVHLFERCVVVCALYDEFWLKYTRWMIATQPERKQEIRNIFRRACSVFVPISRPLIRFQWALYEESTGDILYARDIYQSVQSCTALDIADIEDAYRYRIAFERRQNSNDIDYAQRVCEQMKSSIATTENDNDSGFVHSRILGVVAAQVALNQADEEQTRAVFESHRAQCLDSAYFFIKYFEFESQQAAKRKTTTKTEQEHLHLDSLWKYIVGQTHLAPTVTRDISKWYLDTLETRGDFSRWIEVDSQVCGPFSIQREYQGRLATNV